MHAVFRWAMAVFYVLLATSASAGTIRGSTEKCMYLANSMVMILMIKETSPGMTWETAKANIAPILQEGIGAPDSYLADAEDAETVLRASELIWQDKATVEQIYDSCIRAPARRG